MDRVHRLGQVKDVEVVRFICKDSVEEKIMELQSVKREMTTVSRTTNKRAIGTRTVRRGCSLWCVAFV